jgi:hypothetical protein
MKINPLFIAAAVFNVLVGVPLLLAYPFVASLLQLHEPASVWSRIVAAIVILFAFAYWQVARQPSQYRPYVTLGMIGKLSFAAIIYRDWLYGETSPQLAALVTVDAIFALLFAAHLSRYRSHDGARQSARRID